MRLSPIPLPEEGGDWCSPLRGSVLLTAPPLGRPCGRRAPALRHVDRGIDRGEQTLRRSPAGAGEIKCRAVINRGTDDRQAERDIDAFVKGCVLEHREPLVVIHRQLCVGTRQHILGKQCVRGQRADQVHAFAAQLVQYRSDDFDFLAAHVAPFAGMGVEPGNQDARLRDAELALQVGVQDADGDFQKIGRASCRERV